MSGPLQVEATDRFPGESLLQTHAGAVIRAFGSFNGAPFGGIPATGSANGQLRREWPVATDHSGGN